MKVSIIVAVSENDVIGHKNQLPWHIPADMRYFRQVTSGHAVIMGRKTYESLGKPLKDRMNIVISRKHHYEAPGCVLMDSLEKALHYAKINGEREAFVIGGGQIYQQALSLCDRLYLTRVHLHVEGDTFFPSMDHSWKLIRSEFHPAKENQPAFDFQLLERVSEKSTNP